MAVMSLNFPMLRNGSPPGANAGLLSTLGLKANADIVVHPEDDAAWRKWSDRPIAPPLDIRLRCANNTYRWFRCTPVPPDSEWIPVTDITDLKASAGQLTACLQGLPDLLFELDPNGRYLAYHSPTDRLFLPPERFLGRHLDDVMPPELQGLFDDAIAKVIARPDTPQLVRYVMTVDNETHTYDARLTLSPSGTVICAVRDITELIDAQASIVMKNAELAQINEELEQFVYTASHDLKQPLRMVHEFMKLLKAGYADTVDETANTYIDFAVDGAARMSRMVDSLLLLSRTGSDGLELQAVNTQHALEQVLSDHASEIDDIGATIHAADLAHVWADPDQFHILLSNLVSNALRFHSKTEPPVITVRCTATRTTTTLEVEDNGIGVEPRFQDKLFGMFERGHSQSAYKGTGMGLALCKRVVERHNGTISLSSDGVQGSTFTVTLPNAPQ